MVIGLFNLTMPPLFAEPSESLELLFLTGSDDGRLVSSDGPPDETRKVLVVRGIHGPFTLTEFPEDADPSDSLDTIWRATADNMTFMSSAGGRDVMLETLVERGTLGHLGMADAPLRVEPLESLELLCLPTANDVFRVEGNDGIRDTFIACTEVGCFTAAFVPNKTGRPKSREALRLTGADDEGVTVLDVGRDDGRGIFEILPVLGTLAIPATPAEIGWRISIEPLLLPGTEDVGVTVCEVGRDDGRGIRELLEVLWVSIFLASP